MDIHRLLNTPPRRRLPSEILETPPPAPIPLSQLSTQSWDSQNGPRPPTPFSQLTTQSWDSQNGPRPSPSPLPSPSPPRTPKNPRAAELTRSDRIRIKTALDFGHKPKEIIAKYPYTLRQIQWAKEHRVTPQKHRTGRHNPKIDTPKRRELENWFLQSPSRRYIPFRNIPEFFPPSLGLQDCREYAVRTAFKLVGYGRRVAIKKGFSEDLDVMRERVDFAEEAITWTPERLFNQIFSDEVWAMGGAHTRQYVTVKEDGSDRFDPACVQHKYRKLPSWMFHGTIVMGGKGPAVFWEKEWGSIDSFKYDAVILNNIQAFLNANPDKDFIWMQDNAPSHRSYETQENLAKRRIPFIKFPRYSPDLNLIVHV